MTLLYEYFEGTGQVMLNVRCDSCIFTAYAAIPAVYYLRPSSSIFSTKKCGLASSSSLYLIFLVFFIVAVVSAKVFEYSVVTTLIIGSG